MNRATEVIAPAVPAKAPRGRRIDGQNLREIHRLVELHSALRSSTAESQSLGSLSPEERRILEEVSRGRLDVHTRTEAAMLYIKLGNLLPPE